MRSARLGALVVFGLICAIAALLVVRATDAEPARPSPPPTEVRAVEGARSNQPVPAHHNAKRHVAGVVLFENRPIGAASVRLEPDPLFGGDAVAERRSDASGAFDFGDITPGVYIVSAGAPARTAAVMTVNLNDGVAADSLRLILTACSDSLTGTVTDSGGGVVTHARIHQPSALGVETADDGAFELCLSAGVNVLVAEANGYGSIQFRIAVTERTRKDLVLVPAGFIVGQVVDAQGLAASRARVRFGQLNQSDISTPPASAVADAEGHFRIAVAPGVYWVSATDGQKATGTSATVTVMAGHESEGIVLRLDGAGARLLGVVRNGNTPVAGARVIAVALSFSERVYALSDSDGAFVFPSLSPGKRAIAVDPWEVVSPRQVDVQGGEQTIEVEVRSSPAIHGVVRRHGKPVTDAKVTATCLIDARTGTSGSDGSYRITGLKAGLCDLVAQSERVKATVRESVALQENEDKAFDLELRNGASLSGVVISNHKPLANAHVHCVHSVTDDTGVSRTDSKGRFSCNHLTGGGKYIPRVYSSAGELLETRGAPFPLVDLPTADSQARDVVLALGEERALLSGIVVDAAGRPAPDVSVAPRGEVPNEAEELPHAITDLQGHFSLELIGSHRWALEANAPDGSTGDVVDVAAGSSNIVVALQRTGLVVGSLEGFKRTPSVLLSDIHESVTPVNTDGLTFRVAVRAGRYLVTARAAEEGDTQWVDVKAGATSELTLKARGSAEVSGTVVDHETGAPIEGLPCHTVTRAGADLGMANWSIESSVRTDARGMFRDEHAPAGDIAVLCFGMASISAGVGYASVGAGEKAQVAIEVVRRRSDRGGSIGVTFASVLETVRIATVRPNSGAARAGIQIGDIVVAIDDRPVTGLDYSGVAFLVMNHAAASPLKLTTSHEGQLTTRLLMVEPD